MRNETPQKDLFRELHGLRTMIADYKLKPDPNTEYLAKLQRLERAIVSYIKFAERDPIPLMARLISTVAEADTYRAGTPDNRILFEVIRKQAMIIELAGIQFPTIAQSEQLLRDMLHIKNNNLNKLGSAYPVTIPYV